MGELNQREALWWVRARRLVFGPLPIWDEVSSLIHSSLRGAFYFRTRDAFEDFVAVLQVHDSGLRLATKLEWNTTNPVLTSEELFALTDGPVRFLSIATSFGDIVIDNRRLIGTLRVTANGHDTDAVFRANVIRREACRFIRRIPWWKPWLYIDRSVLTHVTKAERHDVVWRWRTAVISSVLGGVLGFFGGVLSRVVVPG